MSDTIEKVDPGKLTKPQLIELAKEAGVTIDGTKGELAARINEKRGEGAAPSAPPADSPTPDDATPTGAVSDSAGKKRDADTAPIGGPVADDAKPADHEESKQAEIDGKEASVPPSDPRESVTDHAPGKSYDDVVQQKADHDAGKTDGEPGLGLQNFGVQYYVVQDETDLIAVARTLGLFDHSELASLNGRHNGRHDVQRGQRVVLPQHYDFKNLDNVEVE